METDNLKKVVHDITNPEFNKMMSLIKEKLDPIINIVDEVVEIETNVHTLRNDLTAYPLVAKYKIDAFEQYTRHDNVKLSGIPESEEDGLRYYSTLPKT